jgi:hypothetical protein
MNDFTFCIKFVEHFNSLLPYRQRWCKKDLNYWRAVVDTIAHSIKMDIQEMLLACLGTHFFELLVEAFSRSLETSTGAADIEGCAMETSRDPPPKIFIPIPKIELRGTARSDSLICSLIF